MRAPGFAAITLAASLIVAGCGGGGGGGGGDGKPFTGGSLAVFPGAQGFGAGTRAGRGGAIMVVSNLDESGPGSLREALTAAGPRIIVFEVGGVIDLGTDNDIYVREPYFTLAGQTAPAPGITIIGSGIQIHTNDGLIQHIAIRPGDKGGAGWEPDGISIGSRPVYNIVVDHCSFTWGIDENASVSADVIYPNDVTFSNCIIAEGLSESVHSKGEHSKGTLIGKHSERVSLIRNLYAHNYERNPRMAYGSSALVLNNVVYNPGFTAMSMSASVSIAPVASVVGNLCIAGADSRNFIGLVGSDEGDVVRVYLEGNRARTTDGSKRPIVATDHHTFNSADMIETADPEVWLDRLAIIDVDDLLARVASDVGMRPGDRDPIDQRIVDDVLDGTGGIIDSQNDVGGYPGYAETSHALAIPADPHGDDDGDGYTNVEEWLWDITLAVESKVRAKAN